MSGTYPGVAMIRALLFIAEHPGCAKLPAARAAGSNGSIRYGYEAVNNCMRQGLIESTSTGKSGQIYSLVLTERGHLYLCGPESQGA